MDIAELVTLLAAGIRKADARRPVAVNSRSGVPYQPGIGPHTQSQTTRLAVQEVVGALPALTLEVPYPNAPRRSATSVSGAGAVGGRSQDAPADGRQRQTERQHADAHSLALPAHRSALTDCAKLLQSGFEARKAIVIFGYDYDAWPMDPAIEAFEALASRTSALTCTGLHAIDALVHPVHRAGVSSAGSSSHLRRPLPRPHQECCPHQTQPQVR